MTNLLSQPAALVGATPRWRELTVPVRYEAVTRWEERSPDKVTRTVIVKHLTLSAARHGDGLRVVLATAPPLLRKPDLTPLEEVVLPLAALYQHLVVDTTATGAITGLANQAEIAQTWAVLKPALAVRYGA